MAISNTLMSALRALSNIPDLKSSELEQFSQSVLEDSPMPDAHFGADPVWLIRRDTPTPEIFAPLIRKLRAAAGLVTRNGYVALALPDVDIVVTEPTLNSMIASIATSPLTGAETRLATQLLQGLNLRDAAAVDETSYETKRSQFKSLASKLSLRGQSEVVRVLTTHVIKEMGTLAAPDRTSDLSTFAEKYLPKDVRRLTIVAPSGGSVPVLEYGPLRGDPLIVLHPMFMPPITEADIAHAHAQNVRLIWPLRPGKLDSGAPVLNSKSHLAASVEGLLAVIDQITGGPVPVLAFVSSGAVATRAANARPDAVSSISFIATCYSTGRSTVKIPYFGAELVELAFRSEAIMTRTVAGMRKYVASNKRFRNMWLSTFRASNRDVTHVLKEFDGPDKGERLKLVTLQSPESIKHDFFNQTQFSWDEVSKLSVPRRFLHGSDDSIHPPEALAKILARVDEPPLTVAKGMGHLPHFEDLRSSIDFALSWQRNL